MKYHICYTENIPHHLDAIEAKSPSEAIKVLWKIIENGKGQKEADGAPMYQIINIKDEEDNEFVFFKPTKLTQWRLDGHGLDEAKRLGLTD